MRHLFLAASSFLGAGVIAPSNAALLPYNGIMDGHSIVHAVASDSTQDTSTVRLATITTDTGDFAPGHRDFSRYDAPGMCLAAARSVQASFSRSIAAQSLREVLAISAGGGDTVGVGATLPIIQSCGKQFTPESVGAHTVDDLVYLALYKGSDTLLQRGMAKEIASHAEGRADFIESVVLQYLNFGRPVSAATLLEQTESHGPYAGTLTSAMQLALYAQLRWYYENAGDMAHAREIDDHIAEFIAHDSKTEETYVYLRGHFAFRMRQAIMESAESQIETARQAQSALQRYSKADQTYNSNEPYVNWASVSIDSIVTLISPDWYSSVRQHGGGRTKAPRLQADYWFPAPGHPASDTVFPVHGKVNVICTGGVPVDIWGAVFNHSRLHSGYQQATQLKRWLSMYGDQGLTVTVVRSVRDRGGLWADVGNGGRPSNNFQRPATPHEAADAWRWYDQSYHQLPVAVAAQTVHITKWLPAPDARASDTSQIQYQEYVDAIVPPILGRGVPDLSPGSCSVIDRDGSLLYMNVTNGIDWDTWWNVEHLLAWLFHGPTVVNHDRVRDASPAARHPSPSAQ